MAARLAFTLLFTPLVSLFLYGPNSNAGELEFFGGANVTTYDDAPDANSWGLSLRAQYDWFWNDHGFFLNIDAPGLSLLAGEFTAGYEFRTHGDWFVEAGAGYGYSQIFGSDIVPLIGTGYHLTKSFYVDLPLSLKEGGLVFGPMLGLQF